MIIFLANSNTICAFQTQLIKIFESKLWKAIWIIKVLLSKSKPIIKNFFDLITYIHLIIGKALADIYDF